MQLNLTLPWPDKKLSPNSRLCWQAKLKPKRTAFDTAYFETKKEMNGHKFSNNLRMTISFHAPDKSRRDVDNMLAMLKPTIDGVFKALEMDDCAVKEYILQRSSPIKKGMVELSIEDCDA